MAQEAVDYEAIHKAVDEMSTGATEALNGAQSIYEPEFLRTHPGTDTRVTTTYDKESNLLFHIMHKEKKGKKPETTIVWRTFMEDEATIPSGSMKIHGGSSIQSESAYFQNLVRPDFFALIQPNEHLKHKKHTVSADDLTRVNEALQRSLQQERRTYQIERDALMLNVSEKLNNPFAPIKEKLWAENELHILEATNKLSGTEIQILFGRQLDAVRSPLFRMRLILDSYIQRLSIGAMIAGLDALDASKRQWSGKNNQDDHTGNH